MRRIAGVVALVVAALAALSSAQVLEGQEQPTTPQRQRQRQRQRRAAGRGVNRGYAIAFQGVASLAAVDKGLIDFDDVGMRELGEEITIACWQKHHEYEVQSLRMGLSWTNKVGLNWLQPFMGYSGFVFGGLEIYNGTSEYSTDDWHHYAFTYNGQHAVIYVDGEVNANRTFTESPRLREAGTSFFLGTHLYERHDALATVDENRNFLGLQDEVVVLTRALSQDEIVRELIKANPDPARLPEAVLLYDFEVKCPTPGLAPDDPSCSITGDGRVPNRGSAGRDYDLVLGQIGGTRDDRGQWARVQENLDTGCPDLHPFSSPLVVAARNTWNADGSGAPAANAVETPDDLRIPTVLHVVPGAEATLDWPRGTEGKRFSVRAGPPANQGELVTQGGLPVGDSAVAGEPLIFRAAAGMERPLALALVQDENEDIVWTIHAWPARPPEIDPEHLKPDIIRDLQEDHPGLMRLSLLGIDFSGESLRARVTELPRRGTLNQVTHQGLGMSHHLVGPNITTQGEIVTHKRGYVLYTPLPDGEGEAYDSFTMVLESPTTGLATLPTTVRINVEQVDDLPIAVPAAYSVAEDSAAGVIIEPEASDPDSAVSIVVSSLPHKGSLFTVLANGTRGERITEPYSLYQTSGEVVEQYASRVLNVSSFWGKPPSISYHAIAVVGPPTCPDFGENTECRDTRFLDPEYTLIPGELVMVDRWFRHRARGRWPLMMVCAVRAREGQGSAALYELESLPMQRFVGPNRTPTPCIMQGLNYPDDCSVEEAAANAPSHTLRFRDVPPSELLGIGNGAWSPLKKTYEGAKMKGGESAAAYGDQFRFDHDQALAYSAASFPKYTEFIEVGFETLKYPLAVEIGSPRGTGAVVAIKARTPSGEWEPLYRGNAQPELNKQTNARGLNHVFVPNLCRPFFKTAALRIELDTSLETGVDDWNYIDFVKFIGSDEVQPSMLAVGATQLLYVPDPDHFGEDALGITAYDCGGDRMRASEEQQITIAIEPSPDVPVVQSLTVPLSFDASTDETKADSAHRVLVPLKVSDPDGGLPSVTITQLPSFGTLHADGKVIAVGDAVTPDASGAMEVEFVSDPCTTAEPRRAEFRVTATSASGLSSEAVMAVVVGCDRLPHKFVFEEVGPGAASFALSLSLLGAVLVFLASGFNIYYRHVPIVNLTSPRINLVMLAGCGMVYGYVATFWARVSNVSACTTEEHWDLARLRQGADFPDFNCIDPGNACCVDAAVTRCYVPLWVLSVGISLAFGCLFQKTMRISRLFRGTRRGLVLSDTGLVRDVVLLAGVVVTYLITWAAASPSKVRFTQGKKQVDEASQVIVVPLFATCDSRYHDYFFLALVLFFALLFAYGAKLAFQVRKVYISACNDAWQIFASVYNAFIFGALNVGLSRVVLDSTSQLYVLASTTFCCVTITVVVLFGPRMLDIWNGHTQIQKGPKNAQTAEDEDVEPMPLGTHAWRPKTRRLKTPAMMSLEDSSMEPQEFSIEDSSMEDSAAVCSAHAVFDAK